MASYQTAQFALEYPPHHSRHSTANHTANTPVKGARYGEREGDAEAERGEGQVGGHGVQSAAVFRRTT